MGGFVAFGNNVIFIILTHRKMNAKGHCYPKSIILQAVYFKLRFALSYRDVEEIMKIRGVLVDYATIQRWVYKFTSFIESEMKKRKGRVGAAGD
jgi:putative transposase